MKSNEVNSILQWSEQGNNPRGGNKISGGAPIMQTNINLLDD